VTLSVQGVGIPDSKLAREITELVRDTASPLLFHHSSRVYYFGALAGKRRSLSVDPELLYAGAMFHDMGLTPKHSSAEERFEVDGANTARNFLRSHRSAAAMITLQSVRMTIPRRRTVNGAGETIQWSERSSAPIFNRKVADVKAHTGAGPLF
jgi:HD superfamily phosphodiesterase